MKVMKSLMILSIGLIGLLSSCKSEKHNVFQDVSSHQTKGDMVQQYLDDNTFINLDVKALARDLASSASTQDVDAQKVALMKVALYRFYSHVDLEDGVYKCNLSRADEINVSDEVFHALLDNLQEMNLAIANARKEGKDINLSKIDQEYLNRLLK